MQGSNAEAGRGETVNLATCRGACKAGSSLDLLSAADSDPKRLLNCPMRDWVFLDPFYKYENNKLFPCFFPNATALFSSLLCAGKGLIQPRLECHNLVNLYVVSSWCKCPNKHNFKCGLFSTTGKWLPKTNSSGAKCGRKRRRNKHHKRRFSKKKFPGVE